MFSKIAGVVADFCETNYNINNKYRVISGFLSALFECILMYLPEFPDINIWYCFGVAHIGDQSVNKVE